MNLISQHFGTAARRVSAEVRISAEWKLQHPLWDHRKNHGGERRKLAEIMDDDEHIEALAWGDYRPAGAKEELYGGIIAATGRRLLLVSNGLLEQNVSQLSYEGIDGVALKSGDLIITAKSGHSGYEIFSIDDMDPHDSRNKGYGEGICITSSGACRNRSPTGISTLNTTATAHLALAATSTSAPCSSVEAASQNPLTNVASKVTRKTYLLPDQTFETGSIRYV